MSENQQPLKEEQTTPQPETEPAESVLPAATDSEALPDAVEPIADEEIEEEDIDPAEVRIFNMPRVQFHCTALGAALGYVISGAVGIAGFNAPSATVCAIICGVIGFLIGRQLYKKQHAEREAAKQAAQTTENQE